jgi:hypothetical protein
MDIKLIFTKEVIKNLKENKHEITEELLDVLRSHGNVGKQIAIDILDIEKDREQYYLDAFGNRLSYNGNRALKKAFTKLPLAKIHEIEIGKCAADVHYFKDNYVKITTKSGVNFPDIRGYQNEFIDLLDDDDEDAIIGLMGRQSSKTISTSIYMSHQWCFEEERNMGIVANKAKMAREFLSNVKNILITLPIWMVPGIETWNKSLIESESAMRILTDVPSADAFRGFTINLAVIDESAFIRPNIWEEFIDAFLPSQSALAWKKNIILSTPKGMNHFYKLVKGASPKYDTGGSGIKPKGKIHNGYTLFKVDWRDVPRYDKNGVQLDNNVFMNNIIDKHGLLYWRQNFECVFNGSSLTLISAERLKDMVVAEPEEIRDGKLNIYEYPIKGHRYIMTVDASKDGEDAFGVQIVDVTDFNFKQAASAKLQIDYLLMPEFIYEWCEYYNFPYLIIENNEGAGQSIADQLRNDYEYENLHYDNKTESNSRNISKARKGYPGFRTTTKTRRQILQTLKLFIENGKMAIFDDSTVAEFYRFILHNNKYQADEGAHDDMVMALALVFVPFCNVKNFEDMKSITKTLYSDGDLTEEEKVSFSEMLTVGCFNDGTDEEYEQMNQVQRWDGVDINEGGFV